MTDRYTDAQTYRQIGLTYQVSSLDTENYEKIARLRLSCDSYCTLTDSTKLKYYCMLLYYN